MESEISDFLSDDTENLSRINYDLVSDSEPSASRFDCEISTILNSASTTVSNACLGQNSMDITLSIDKKRFAVPSPDIQVVRRVLAENTQNHLALPQSDFFPRQGIKRKSSNNFEDYFPAPNTSGVRKSGVNNKTMSFHLELADDSSEIPAAEFDESSIAPLDEPGSEGEVTQPSKIPRISASNRRKADKTGPSDATFDIISFNETSQNSSELEETTANKKAVPRKSCFFKPTESQISDESSEMNNVSTWSEKSQSTENSSNDSNINVKDYKKQRKSIYPVVPQNISSEISDTDMTFSKSLNVTKMKEQAGPNPELELSDCTNDKNRTFDIIVGTQQRDSSHISSFEKSKSFVTKQPKKSIFIREIRGTHETVNETNFGLSDLEETTSTPADSSSKDSDVEELKPNKKAAPRKSCFYKPPVSLSSAENSEIVNLTWSENNQSTESSNDSNSNLKPCKNHRKSIYPCVNNVSSEVSDTDMTFSKSLNATKMREQALLNNTTKDESFPREGDSLVKDSIEICEESAANSINQSLEKTLEPMNSSEHFSESLDQSPVDINTSNNSSENYDGLNQSAEAANSANQVKLSAGEANNLEQFGEQANYQNQMIDEAKTPNQSVHEPNTPNLLEKENNPEDLVETSSTSKQLVGQASTPKQLVEEASTPKKLVEDANTPKQFVENANTPKQLVEEASTPKQLVEEASTSTQLVEEANTPKQVVEEASTPKQLVEEASTPKQLVEASTPKQVVDKASTPKQLFEEASSAKQLVEKTSTPLHLGEKANCPNYLVEEANPPNQLIGGKKSPNQSAEFVNSPKQPSKVVNLPDQMVEIINSPNPSVEDANFSHMSEVHSNEIVEDINLLYESVNNENSLHRSVIDVNCTMPSFENPSSQHAMESMIEDVPNTLNQSVGIVHVRDETLIVSEDVNQVIEELPEYAVEMPEKVNSPCQIINDTPDITNSSGALEEDLQHDEHTLVNISDNINSPSQNVDQTSNSKVSHEHSPATNISDANESQIASSRSEHMDYTSDFSGFDVSSIAHISADSLEKDVSLSKMGARKTGFFLGKTNETFSNDGTFDITSSFNESSSQKSNEEQEKRQLGKTVPRKSVFAENVESLREECSENGEFSVTLSQNTRSANDISAPRKSIASQVALQRSEKIVPRKSVFVKDRESLLSDESSENEEFSVTLSQNTRSKNDISGPRKSIASQVASQRSGMVPRKSVFVKDVESFNDECSENEEFSVTLSQNSRSTNDTSVPRKSIASKVAVKQREKMVPRKSVFVEAAETPLSDECSEDEEISVSLSQNTPSINNSCALKKLCVSYAATDVSSEVSNVDMTFSKSLNVTKTRERLLKNPKSQLSNILTESCNENNTFDVNATENSLNMSSFEKSKSFIGIERKKSIFARKIERDSQIPSQEHVRLETVNESNFADSNISGLDNSKQNNTYTVNNTFSLHQTSDSGVIGNNETFTASHPVSNLDNLPIISSGAYNTDNIPDEMMILNEEVSDPTSESQEMTKDQDNFANVSNEIESETGDFSKRHSTIITESTNISVEVSVENDQSTSGFENKTPNGIASPCVDSNKSTSVTELVKNNEISNNENNSPKEKEILGPEEVDKNPEVESPNLSIMDSQTSLSEDSNHETRLEEMSRDSLRVTRSADRTQEQAKDALNESSSKTSSPTLTRSLSRSRGTPRTSSLRKSARITPTVIPNDSMDVSVEKDVSWPDVPLPPEEDAFNESSTRSLSRSRGTPRTTSVRKSARITHFDIPNDSMDVSVEKDVSWPDVPLPPEEDDLNEISSETSSPPLTRSLSRSRGTPRTSSVRKSARITPTNDSMDVSVEKDLSWPDVPLPHEEDALNESSSMTSSPPLTRNLSRSRDTQRTSVRKSARITPTDIPNDSMDVSVEKEVSWPDVPLPPEDNDLTLCAEPNSHVETSPQIHLKSDEPEAIVNTPESPKTLESQRVTRSLSLDKELQQVQELTRIELKATPRRKTLAVMNSSAMPNSLRLTRSLTRSKRAKKQVDLRRKTIAFANVSRSYDSLLMSNSSIIEFSFDSYNGCSTRLSLGNKTCPNESEKDKTEGKAVPLDPNLQCDISRPITRRHTRTPLVQHNGSAIDETVQAAAKRDKRAALLFRSNLSIDNIPSSSSASGEENRPRSSKSSSNEPSDDVDSIDAPEIENVDFDSRDAPEMENVDLESRDKPEMSNFPNQSLKAIPHPVVLNSPNLNVKAVPVLVNSPRGTLESPTNYIRTLQVNSSNQSLRDLAEDENSSNRSVKDAVQDSLDQTLKSLESQPVKDVSSQDHTLIADNIDSSNQVVNNNSNIVMPKATKRNSVTRGTLTPPRRSSPRINVSALKGDLTNMSVRSMNSPRQTTASYMDSDEFNSTTGSAYLTHSQHVCETISVNSSDPSSIASGSSNRTSSMGANGSGNVNGTGGSVDATASSANSNASSINTTKSSTSHPKRKKKRMLLSTSTLMEDLTQEVPNNSSISKSPMLSQRKTNLTERTNKLMSDLSVKSSKDRALDFTNSSVSSANTSNMETFKQPLLPRRFSKVAESRAPSNSSSSGDAISLETPDLDSDDLSSLTTFFKHVNKNSTKIAQYGTSTVRKVKGAQQVSEEISSRFDSSTSRSRVNSKSSSLSNIDISSIARDKTRSSSKSKTSIDLSSSSSKTKSSSHLSSRSSKSKASLAASPRTVASVSPVVQRPGAATRRTSLGYQTLDSAELSLQGHPEDSILRKILFTHNASLNDSIASEPTAKRGKANENVLELVKENGEIYKPKKLFTHKQAPWINKRLYKFLHSKLEAKYKLKTRLVSEYFTKLFYQKGEEIHKNGFYAPNAENKACLDYLMNKMVGLGLIECEWDFHSFCKHYWPPPYGRCAAKVTTCRDMFAKLEYVESEDEDEDEEE